MVPLRPITIAPMAAMALTTTRVPFLHSVRELTAVPLPVLSVVGQSSVHQPPIPIRPRLALAVERPFSVPTHKPPTVHSRICPARRHHPAPEVCLHSVAPPPTARPEETHSAVGQTHPVVPPLGPRSEVWQRVTLPRQALPTVSVATNRSPSVQARRHRRVNSSTISSSSNNKRQHRPQYPVGSISTSARTPRMQHRNRSPSPLGTRPPGTQPHRRRCLDRPRPINLRPVRLASVLPPRTTTKPSTTTIPAM